MAEAKKGNMENTRVTALLGAGVNLGLDVGFKPSTAYLTEKVVNANYQVLDLKTSQYKNSDLVQYIYTTICNNYSEGPLDPANSYHIVHFEILFHVLETLYSYGYLPEMQSMGKSLPNRFVPPYAYLSHMNVHYDISEIDQVMKLFITILMDEIFNYNETYKKNKVNGVNKQYNDFWAIAPFKWDVFNLNYDTTIEDSLVSYEDGFVATDPKYDFKTFEPEALLMTEDNTINHLHGCIMYGPEKYDTDEYNDDIVFYHHFNDFYRWDNYANVKNRWVSSSRSKIYAQNHEIIYPSPIITGLSKTEKISPLPFNLYKHNFSLKLMTNRSLLIAGYSFGDLYLNQELERMRFYHGNNWKVVIVDKWDFANYAGLDEIEKLKFYIQEQKVGDELVRLMCKVAHVNYIERTTFDVIRPGQFISKNGQLMLFVGGMNDTIQYANNIYSFLQ